MCVRPSEKIKTKTEHNMYTNPCPIKTTQLNFSNLPSDGDQATEADFSSDNDSNSGSDSDSDSDTQQSPTSLTVVKGKGTVTAVIAVMTNVTKNQSLTGLK